MLKCHLTQKFTTHSPQLHSYKLHLLVLTHGCRELLAANHSSWQTSFVWKLRAQFQLENNWWRFCPVDATYLRSLVRLLSRSSWLYLAIMACSV